MKWEAVLMTQCVFCVCPGAVIVAISLRFDPFCKLKPPLNLHFTSQANTMTFTNSITQLQGAISSVHLQ